jgi:DNA ligase-1
MEFPTLYHKAKTGKIVSWTIKTDGASIITEYGEIDGKKQIACKVATPKNVGKSNETTAVEQAILEAQSMHKHRLERKYSLSPETAEEELVFLPMLAHEFEKHKSHVSYPVFVQPKLDGVRCLAFWEEVFVDGELRREVKLLSRGGKEYSLPHVQEALHSILPPDTVFDGELYIHGETLQGINRLVKKFRVGPDGTTRIQYHVYDAFQTGSLQTPFSERLASLRSIFSDKEEGIVRFVRTDEVSSAQEVYQKMGEFIGLNYEGAIVRKPQGPYELGYRSRSLLKVKTFFDAEFRIVGHSFGTGRAEKSVVWQCITEDGKLFSVVPRGTIEEREAWGAHAKKYYGKLLTVRFWNRTEDNVPQFPVGVAIRLEEDL